MQEVINCPNCQRKLQVPEELLGQDVQCPTCGTTFLARSGEPASSRPTETPSSIPRDPAPPRPSPGQRDDYGSSRYRRADHLPHRGSTILTLGILSLVLGLIGLILGPIAWTMGNADLREIRAGRMDPEGEGLTNAGRICGIIGFCKDLLVFVLCCGSFFFFFLMAASNAGRR